MMEEYELKSICELTIELTKLRQNEVKHLAIENFAPELFSSLIIHFKGAKESNSIKGYLKRIYNHE